MFKTASRRRHLFRGAVWGAALLAAAFVAKGTLFGSGKHEAAAPTLTVAAVAPRDISQVLEVPGEFRPFQETDLNAKVHGYVQKMNNDVGDAVKEGAVLATLEIPELKDDLRSADAAVAVAQQQVEKANAQYLDDKTMYERLLGVSRERPELVAQQDVDQEKAHADAAAAALTAAQAAVRQAIANRTRYQDTDAYAKIVAPFDGVITRRYVDEGALVGAAGGGAGNTMFHIAEVDKLRLVIMVPESAVPDLALGKIARVTVPALERSFDLPVSRISRQLAEDTRTMHVEIDFDNRGGTVAPGMYAQVVLPLKVRSQVLALPLGALHERDKSQAKVYVLDAGGQAHARQVGLGLFGADYVEIASGLHPGELVAVDMTPQTGEGAKYTPKRIAGDRPVD